MAVFTILYGNYYTPRGEFELICIGKFSIVITIQYSKNRHTVY